MSDLGPVYCIYSDLDIRCARQPDAHHPACYLRAAREAGADAVTVDGGLVKKVWEEACEDETCGHDRALTDDHGVCLIPPGRRRR